MKKFTFSLLLFFGLAMQGFSQCPTVNVSYSAVNTSGYAYTFTNTSTGTNGNQTYIWSVGSDTVGYSSSLNYTFASSGSYLVCLNINEPGCPTSYYYCNSYNVGETCPSVNPNFTYTHTGNTYTFTDASTGENGNQFLAWLVNDSTTSATGATMEYTFPNNGSYQVCLGVTEFVNFNLCDFGPFCKTIAVGSSCPTVTTTFVETSHTNYTYTFTNTSSGTDGNQTYDWTVNGISVSTAANLTYTFPSPGSYNVCLNITEPGGCTYTSHCLSISIPCPAVTASFTDVNTTGNSYTFTNSSTGTDGSQTYAWTVNSTSVGTASTLSYTFSSPGSYNVCLAITEPGGCTYTSYCKTITIACPTVNLNFTYTNVGNTYTFTDASTGESGSQAAGFSINGGTPVEGSPYTYTFTGSGSNQVCLYVAEAFGGTPCEYGPYCKTITIGNCPSIVTSFTSSNSSNNW